MKKSTKKVAKKATKKVKVSRLGKSGTNMHDFVMALFKKNKNITEDALMAAVKKEFPQWEPKKYFGIWRKEAGIAAPKKSSKKEVKKAKPAKKGKKTEAEEMEEGETTE